MAVILNKESIDRSIAKVVELGNEFVINGHVYDKNSLSPIPLAFVPTVASTNNEMLLYKTLMLGGNHAVNLSKKNFVIDNSDPNIAYVFYTGYYQNPECHKIVKTNKGYEIATKNTTIGSESKEIWEVIGQDNDRIYIRMQREARNAYGYIISYNKQTLIADWSINFGVSRLSVIKETDSHIYAGSTTTNNNFKIVKINKLNGVSTTIFTSSLTGWSNVSISSDIDESGNFYVIRDKFSISGQHEIMIKRYNINFNNDVVAIANTDMDLSIMGSLPFEQTIPIGSDNWGAYELYRHKDVDGSYITLMVFDYGFGATYLNADDCAMYTFKIVNQDTLQLIHYEKFTPKLYRGVMPLYNNTLLLLADENGVNFYNWNSIRKKFEKTTSRQIPCIVIGADMSNNIWLQYTTGEIELLANTLPIKIETDFALDEYHYKGEDIPTTIFARAENYLGQKLATRLTFQLIGDVVFTENDTKTITKTTSATGDLTIPVTIKGSGLLQINARVM